MSERYDVADLVRFAAALLVAAGLDERKADVVAEILVEGDLLGHTTHGTRLLRPYVAELQAGCLRRSGDPEVVADHGACVTWDGRRLPGPWLVCRAIDLACGRAARHGVVTVAIRRSHHTACLAAYLQRATARNLVVLLASSDSSDALVAPHGGARPVYAPNPIAVGWPTGGAPVLLDISTSITSYGLAKRQHQRGEKLPGDWAIDNQGNPTDDPGAMFTDPPGALLPVGGTDHGHKGYALGLMVEMLTSALAGGGRADALDGWCTSVYVQVIDPEALGGREAFLREAGWLAAACRQTPPAPWYRAAGGERVRLPGEAALARRAVALAGGLTLCRDILAELENLAAELGVTPPSPLP